MEEDEKADLVSEYVDRIIEDMDHKTMVAIVVDILFDEKLNMDTSKLLDEIQEYYPDLLPEGE